MITCVLESLSDGDTQMFLLILHHLVPQLSIAASKHTSVAAAADADDSDSDNETMDIDGQVCFVTSSLIACWTCLLYTSDAADE